MSGQPFWARLSVQEFFSRYNWQGYPLNGTPVVAPATALSLLNGTPVVAPGATLSKLKQLFESASPEPSWLSLTIQEFFSHSNWQGHSLTSNSNPTRSCLSLTLPVSDFFQFIVWEGHPEIAVLPQVTLSPELTSSSSQNLKLTDLSELF